MLAMLSPRVKDEAYDALCIDLIRRELSTEGIGHEIQTLATSLREVLDHPIDRNGFVAAFLSHLERWLVVYRVRGAGPVLMAWNESGTLRGRVVEARDRGVTRRGRVAGVDDEGRLVLERGPGTERAIASGEIVAFD